MMKKELLLAVLCVLTACKQKTEVSKDVVERTLTEYDSIYSDKENPSGMVVEMNASNGLLVAKHMMDSCTFSIIDIEGKRLLRRWGKVGEGANEVIDFGGGFELHDSLLVFNETMKKNLITVSLPQLLSNPSDVKLHRFPYPYNVDFRPLNFCTVGGYKVFSGYFQDKRLGVVDAEGRIVGTASDYLFDDEGLDNLNKSMLFLSKIKSAPSSSRFVLRTLLSDVVEIYSLSPDGTLERTYLSPIHLRPQLTKRGDRFVIDYARSSAGILGVSLSERYIYFSFSDRSYDEVSKENCNTQEILCYDWTGRLVAKYRLPFPIHSFCVDEHNLYAVRYLEEDAVFCRFQLE